MMIRLLFSICCFSLHAQLTAENNGDKLIKHELETTNPPEDKKLTKKNPFVLFVKEVLSWVNPEKAPVSTLSYHTNKTSKENPESDQLEILPRRQTPSTNKSNTKKDNRFSLFGDVLYFKMTEGSINYAELVPQNATYTPTVKSISQEFDYKPGFRIGACGAIGSELWNIKATWMYYRASPRSRKASRTGFGILATLSTPVWGSQGNSQVNKVKGKWSLLMNAADLDIQRIFKFKGFSIASIAGIKLGFIDQKINIHYGEFLDEFPDVVTPRTVEAKSSFWGIGPLLGVELGYLVSKRFKFFILGAVSCLPGNIQTKTFYKDFSTQAIDTPEYSVIKIEDSKTLVSIFEQFQLGINQQWTFKKMKLEAAVGWEIQVWQRQMQINAFSTFISQSNNEDLSLYGPFLKIKINF